MIEASNKAIRKVKCSVNGKEWIYSDIRDHVKRQNMLGKYITNKRAEWIEACMTVPDMIRKSKENICKEFLEDSDSSSNSHKIWSTFKSLNGRRTASIRNETLVHDGKEYVTHKANADSFLQRYFENNRLSLPKACRIKNALPRSLVGPIVEDPSSIPFNVAEMSKTITNMKVKSAPGKDKIHPRFIKALGPIASNFKLRIFNDSWKAGICRLHRGRHNFPHPECRPASQIDSFRPVSLTSCVAKTMERMVVRKAAVRIDGVRQNDSTMSTPGSCTHTPTISLLY